MQLQQRYKSFKLGLIEDGNLVGLVIVGVLVEVILGSSPRLGCVVEMKEIIKLYLFLFVGNLCLTILMRSVFHI